MLFRGGGGICRSPSEDQVRYSFSGCSSGCLLAYSMNSAGLSRDGRLKVCAQQGLLMPQPPYSMHLGRRDHPLSAFGNPPVYGRREPWYFLFFFDDPSLFSNETLMPPALLSGSFSATKGINVGSREANLNVEHQESRLCTNSCYICARQHRL
uniref:Uncharacterized protein n=1 Tax=Fagus sylvatica TaxID=28930 RepID=A0A2N9EUY3_FAGSY